MTSQNNRGTKAPKRKEEKTMKKILSTLLVLALACTMMFAATSCFGDGLSTDPLAEDYNNILKEVMAPTNGKNGTLTVALSPDFAPMEFVDTSLTGQKQYVGFDVILANYIAKELDMSLVIKPMDFYTCMTILANDQVDLAISGFSWTADRAETFLISDYYIAGENETEQILITKADCAIDWNASDLTGIKVGAQGGSLQQLLVNEQLVATKNATIVLNDDINMLKTMLINGQVDAVAVARGNGAALTANTPELKPVEEDGEYSGFNFFVEEKYQNNVVLLNKNDTELLEKVNTILAKAMEADVYDTWYAACEVYAGVSTKDESGYDEEGNPNA